MSQTLNLTVRELAELLSTALGGLAGQVNAWLVGVFLSLALLVVFPSGVFSDGVVELIRDGEFSVNAPTNLYPWQLSPPGIPSGTFIAAGALLWLFAATRAAYRVVRGDVAARGSILALAVNLGLVVGAPAVVAVGVYVYNEASMQLLAALPEDVARDTLSLMAATLGLSKTQGAVLAAILAMARFGAASVPGGSALSIALDAVSGLPTLLLVAWGIVMLAVAVQVLLAILFLGLTPWYSWLFSLLGDRLDTAVVWLRLTLRAFAAAGLATVTGVLWLAAWTSGAMGGGALGLVATPLLGTLTYAVVAVLLWAVWTRPVLVLIYSALPWVEAWFDTGAKVARNAEGVAAAAGIPGGVLASGVSRWLSARAGDVAEARAAVAEAVTRAPAAWSWQDPAAAVRVEAVETGPPKAPPDDFGITQNLTVGEDGGEWVRLQASAKDTADLLYEVAVQQSESAVREGTAVFLPEGDAERVLGELRRRIRERTAIWEYRGRYYVWAGGRWSRVPPSWVGKEETVFVNYPD